MRVALLQIPSILRRNESRSDAVSKQVVGILVYFLCPLLELRVGILQQLCRFAAFFRRHFVSEHGLQSLPLRNASLLFQLQHIRGGGRNGRYPARLALVGSKEHFMRLRPHDRRIAVIFHDLPQLVFRQLPELGEFVLHPFKIFFDFRYLRGVVVHHAVYIVHMVEIQLEIPILCLILPHRCKRVRKT